MTVEIICKGELKLCVPQRLSLSLVVGLVHLQMRASRAAKVLPI